MRVIVLVLALAPQAALACGMSYRSETVVKEYPKKVAENAAVLTALMADVDAAGVIPEVAPAPPAAAPPAAAPKPPAAPAPVPEPSS